MRKPKILKILKSWWSGQRMCRVWSWKPGEVYDKDSSWHLESKRRGKSHLRGGQVGLQVSSPAATTLHGFPLVTGFSCLRGRRKGWVGVGLWDCVFTPRESAFTWKSLCLKQEETAFNRWAKVYVPSYQTKLSSYVKNKGAFLHMNVCGFKKPTTYKYLVDFWTRELEEG